MEFLKVSQWQHLGKWDNGWSCGNGGFWMCVKNLRIFGKLHIERSLKNNSQLKKFQGMDEWWGQWNGGFPPCVKCLGVTRRKKSRKWDNNGCQIFVYVLIITYYDDIYLEPMRGDHPPFNFEVWCFQYTSIVYILLLMT